MVEQPVTFKEWVNSLEAVVHSKVGLKLRDLPAHDFLPEFEGGLTPEEAFDECIRQELEDLGFHLEIMDLFDEAQLLAAEQPRKLTVDELEYEFAFESF